MKNCYFWKKVNALDVVKEGERYGAWEAFFEPVTGSCRLLKHTNQPTNQPKERWSTQPTIRQDVKPFICSFSVK